MSLVSYSFLNNEWKFTLTGWLDPHIFLNYFIPELNGVTFENNYKVSRIPWIIFGRTIYLILGYDGFVFFLPYIIMLFYSIIFLYFSKHFNLIIYTFGLTFLILTPFFHGAYSGGWTYQNPLLNMLILAGYLITFSIFKNDDAPDTKFYFKIILFSVIFVNIFVLNFLDSLMIIPSLLFIFYKLFKVKFLFGGLSLFILGTSISILVLAISSHLLGYSFAFWNPMIDFYFWLNGSGQNHLKWYQPISSGWWASAYYLIIPFSMSFVCLFHLLRLSRIWIKGRSLKFLTIYDFFAFNHLFLTIFLVITYVVGHVHKILFTYMVQPFYISALLAVMSIVQGSIKKQSSSASMYFSYLYPIIISFFILFYNFDFVSSKVNIVFVLIIVSLILVLIVNLFLSFYPYSLSLVIPIILITTPNFNSQYKNSSCAVNESMSRDFYNIVQLSINLKGPGLILFNGDSTYSVSKNCYGQIRNMADSLNYIGAYSLGLRDLDSVDQNDLKNELDQISHNSIIILGEIESLNLNPDVRNILESKFKSFEIYNKNSFTAEIIVGKN